MLRENQVDFIEHPYKYEEGGGTEVAARELGVDEHLVIKTLVMEDDQKVPFIVLMHGDRSHKGTGQRDRVKSVYPGSLVAFGQHGYIWWNLLFERRNISRYVEGLSQPYRTINGVERPPRIFQPI
jgi:hypothetical protein